MASPEEAGVVLVTGATGFLASHVILQLQQAGYAVRGTVRRLADDEKNSPLRSLCPSARVPLEVVAADLTREEDWLPVVRGCTYVLHLASPFPSAPPRDADSLLRPAIDGTLHVFRACAAAGSVRRVVLTSSMAAMAFGHGADVEERPLTECDWTDATSDSLNPYVKSKTLAERAAWEFVSRLEGVNRFELAVMNPALVLGPVLVPTSATSVELVRRLLERRVRLLPRINVGIVDVRDVAHAHIKAMTLPEAAGHRHILCKQTLWCVDLARIIDAEFRSQGYRIPTAVAPDVLVRLVGLVDRSVRAIVPSIGRRRGCDNTRMKTVLGVMPRDERDTILDMCYSLIELGLVAKMAAYRGPPPPGAEIRFQHSFDETE